MTKITDEDTKKFYAQRDFPETASKLLAISKLLSSSSRFIKENYVLQNRGIDKIKCKDFLELYEEFCKDNNIKSYGRNDFYKKLEVLNIKPKNGTNHSTYFEETAERLQEISKLHKWICKYDEFQTGEHKNEVITVDNMEKLLDENEKMKEENERIKNENLRIKMKLFESSNRMMALMEPYIKSQSIENLTMESEDVRSQMIEVKEKKEVKKKEKKVSIDEFIDSIEIF
jgi:hypothetical protein